MSINVSIKTTLGQIPGVQAVLQQMNDLDLSMKTRYHVGKLLKLVAEEMKEIVDRQNALIKELGRERTELTEEELKAGRQSPILEVPRDSPNYPVLLKQLEDLAMVPVEISWKPLELSSIPDASSEKARGLNLALLVDTFLVDGTEEVEKPGPKLVKAETEKAG